MNCFVKIVLFLVLVVPGYTDEMIRAPDGSLIEYRTFSGVVTSNQNGEEYDIELKLRPRGSRRAQSLSTSYESSYEEEAQVSASGKGVHENHKRAYTSRPKPRPRSSEDCPGPEFPECRTERVAYREQAVACGHVHGWSCFVFEKTKRRLVDGPFGCIDSRGRSKEHLDGYRLWCRYSGPPAPWFCRHWGELKQEENGCYVWWTGCSRCTGRRMAIAIERAGAYAGIGALLGGALGGMLSRSRSSATASSNVNAQVTSGSSPVVVPSGNPGPPPGGGPGNVPGGGP